MPDWWDRLSLAEKLHVAAMEGLLRKVPPWMVAALYEAAAFVSRSSGEGPSNPA